MPFFFRASCSHCSFDQHLGPSGYSNYYWLGPDCLAPMEYTAAWCGGCLRLSIAEEVPTIEELTRRHAWWENWFRERRFGLGDELYDRKVRGWANQLEWRARRLAPPRCLVCSSTAVTHYDLTQDTLPQPPHPGCPGCLRFAREGGHYHDHGLRMYSVEGEFLGFADGFEGFRPPARPLPRWEARFIGVWIPRMGETPA